MRLSDKLQDFLVNGPNMWGPQYETIQQAYRLAKRYEEAPVAELYHTRHERNQYYGELYAENLPDGWEPAFTAIADGQRVRIVLDKEG